MFCRLSPTSYKTRTAMVEDFAACPAVIRDICGFQMVSATCPATRRTSTVRGCTRWQLRQETRLFSPRCDDVIEQNDLDTAAAAAAAAARYASYDMHRTDIACCRLQALTHGAIPWTCPTSSRRTLVGQVAHRHSRTMPSTVPPLCPDVEGSVISIIAVLQVLAPRHLLEQPIL